MIAPVAAPMGGTGQLNIRLLGGLSPINPTRRRARLALEWDSRGPFPPVAVLVGLVVVVARRLGGVDRNPGVFITHGWKHLVTRKLNVIFKSVAYVGLR